MSGATKTTFVTAFYNLAVKENSNRRTSNKYYKYAHEILKRPVDLVFFGEEEDCSRVEEIRLEYGYEDQTKTFVLPFETLPMYENIPQFQKIISKNGIMGYKNNPKLTPNYLALILSKVWFLKKAAESNPYSATHFVWIDFGYFHMREDWDYLLPGRVLDSHFTNINSSWEVAGLAKDRFRICILKDFKEDTIIDAKSFYSVDNCQMAGSVLGGSEKAICAVWEKIQKQVKLSLGMNVTTAEENIIGRIAYFFPELFDFTHGYYSTSLVNFAKITTFPKNSIGLGLKWRTNEKLQQSYDILSKIAEEIISKADLSQTLNKDEIYSVFNELIICSYYTNYQYYKKYAQFFKNWLVTNNYPISDHLKMNLSF